MTKKFNCRQCEYETDVPEYMKEHMRYHEGFVIRESTGYVIRETPK